MKWLKFLQDYAQTLGTVFQNQHGLIFPNKIGKPVDVDTFRRRYFLKIIRAAGLPDGVTMHSLRHTHATLLLQAGVDVKTVSERLGHSTESITLHYYCHVTSKKTNENDFAFSFAFLLSCCSTVPQPAVLQRP